MVESTPSWKRSQIWTTVAIAVGAAVIAGLIVWFAVPQPAAEAAPTPTPSITATDEPEPSPTPEPEPEPTPEPVAATCENIMTAGWLAQMQLQGWTVSETTGDEIGAAPFDAFPGGPPTDQIVCRWAETPGAATDNVFDFARGTLSADAAAEAQDALVSGGYVRENTDAGVVIMGTAEGDDAYLFVGDEVRWAHTLEELGFITVPADAR